MFATMVSQVGLKSYATHNKMSPQAIYYSGVYDRTYFVFQDQGYDPNILYYDHVARVFSTVVKIAESPISDAHAGPCVCIDENGRIHVFYGCHNSELKHAMSNNPEDISAWTVQADVTAEAGYPIARVASNGDIYIFYRSNPGTYIPNWEAYRISTDNGASWGAEVNFINPGAGYGVYHANVVFGSDDSIHIVWTQFYEYEPVKYRRDHVFYAYSTDAGATWKSKDGTNLGAQISKAEQDANCVVYDSSGDPDIEYMVDGYYTAWSTDVVLDTSNNPYVLFFHSKAGPVIQTCVAKWTGAAWGVYEVDSLWGGEGQALDYISATEVYLYHGDWSALKIWKSADNCETWALEDTLVSFPTCHMPKIVDNYFGGLKVVWSQGNATPSDIWVYGLEDRRLRAPWRI